MEILTITKREIIVLISLSHLHSSPLWPSKSEPILLEDCLAILTFDTMANPLLVAEHCMWPIWAMVRIIVTNKIIEKLLFKKKKKSGIFTNFTRFGILSEKCYKKNKNKKPSWQIIPNFSHLYSHFREIYWYFQFLTKNIIILCGKIIFQVNMTILPWYFNILLIFVTVL